MSTIDTQRYERLARFYEVQKALDQVTDPASRTILENLKKELSEWLETHN